MWPPGGLDKRPLSPPNQLHVTGAGEGAGDAECADAEGAGPHERGGAAAQPAAQVGGLGGGSLLGGGAVQHQRLPGCTQGLYVLGPSQNAQSLCFALASTQSSGRACGRQLCDPT